MIRFIRIDWVKPTGAGSSHIRHLQTKSKWKSNLFWNKVTMCLLWAPLSHGIHPSSDRWTDCWAEVNQVQYVQKLADVKEEQTSGWVLYLSQLMHTNCRSQWPRGLRRGSTAARLLGLWVRIPPWAWMFVCVECCVLSGKGLCDWLITRPEKSCRLCASLCVS